MCQVVQISQDIKKIIVNEIPHLNDGTLVFEPEEAAEMHEGICDMVKNNENVNPSEYIKFD